MLYEVITTSRSIRSGKTDQTARLLLWPRGQRDHPIIHVRLQARQLRFGELGLHGQHHALFVSQMAGQLEHLGQGGEGAGDQQIEVACRLVGLDAACSGASLVTYVV